MDNFVNASGCDGGANDLGHFIKSAERPVHRDQYSNEIKHEEMDNDFNLIRNASERPTQLEIENYMNKLSMDGGPPIFQNDEEANEYLAMSNQDFDANKQMDWMNNFWGNFMPSNSADTYNYQFKPENPFIQHPSPFEAAMDHYHKGSLNDAILAFEATVHQDPQSSDAWRWLGTAHAENDEDKLAKINPSDVDIHTVLGVLWNLTREYEHAEEAFKEAIKLDPNNPSLWNKLGATQANSSRPEGSKDAVHAYRKAIELKPNYLRAWVNMGISYANRKMYDVAAKYYLKALTLHSAPHIWSYLRLSLNCMERSDLAALVEERNVDLFRKDFKF